MENHNSTVFHYITFTRREGEGVKISTMSSLQIFRDMSYIFCVCDYLNFVDQTMKTH